MIGKDDHFDAALHLENKAKDRVQQGMFASAASYALDAYRHFNLAGRCEQALKMFDLMIEYDKKYRGIA